MKKVVLINNEISSEENAKISVFDRGFLFGDSIYEVTCTYDNKLLFWREHLERLHASAEKLSMQFEYSDEELTQKCYQVISELNKQNVNRCYLRLIITRGEGKIGLDTRFATETNLVIIGQELKENPKQWYEKGVSAVVAQTLRNPVDSMDPSIKSGNYLNNVLAMNEASQTDAFEAIMLNHQGHVTECTTSNIWIVKDGEYITPPLKSGLLGGITRLKLLEILKEQGLRYKAADFTETQLRQADEIFLTSSTKFIVPITTLDGQKVQSGLPGKLTLDLLGRYHNYIQSKLL